MPRLYAILDVDFARARGCEPREVLTAWLAAGVRLIQLRAKALASGPMLDLAVELAAMVRSAGGTFIINDRADVSRMASAHGVHVGQDDLSPADVRRMVGADAMVGLSTHSTAQARAALLEPVSYVAIGPVFPTATKGRVPDPPVALAGLREVSALVRGAGLPLVAIGGITLENAGAVLDAGASSVAVISGLLTGDLIGRARAFLDVVG